MKKSSVEKNNQSIEILLPRQFAIEPRQIPLILLTLAIALSTCFQLGYFMAVGPEFLSMLGASDYLYSLGLVLFPLAVILPVLVIMFSAASKSILQHGDRSWWVKFVRNGLWWFVGGLIPLSLALTLYGYEGLGQGLRTATIIGALATALAYSAIQYGRHGRLELRIAMAVIGGLMFFTVSIGFIFSRYYAGRPCQIIEASGSEDDYIYLRSLGQGHLIRKGNRVTFVSDSEVKKITCDSIFFASQ